MCMPHIQWPKHDYQHPRYLCQQRNSPVPNCPVKVEYQTGYMQSLRSSKHVCKYPNLYQDRVSWHLKHVMPAFEFAKGGNLAVSLICHFWYTLFVHLYIWKVMSFEECDTANTQPVKDSNCCLQTRKQVLKYLHISFAATFLVASK